MGKKPNRSYDNDKKSEGKVKSLQKALKEKDKEIAQLRSELKTLEKAFEKSAAYMSKESAELTVEQLIEASNKAYTLEQAKKSAPAKGKSTGVSVKRPPSIEEVEKARQEARDRVKAWRKKELGEYEEE